MALSRNKALFVEISEFSILAARTSGFRSPFQIEHLEELPLDSGGDVASFVRGMGDFRNSNFVVARCGVYPSDRFVHYHELDPSTKVKDPSFLGGLLKANLGVDIETNTVAVLDARNGSVYDFGASGNRKLLLGGASTDELRKKQEELLGWELYPERMEISTLTTLGGVSDYSRFARIDSPIICLELTSGSANIVILNRGGLEVSRSVPVGLQSIFPLLQRELALKDENSARKLFFSNTFDFAEMGPKLLRRILKELQASIGFYEVQTGLTVEHLFLGVLPKNLAWISKAISEAMEINILKPNFGSWLESLGVTVSDGVEVSNLGARWFGLFSLMGEFHLREVHGSEQEEKRLTA